MHKKIKYKLRIDENNFVGIVCDTRTLNLQFEISCMCLTDQSHSRKKNLLAMNDLDSTKIHLIHSFSLKFNLTT